MNDKIPAGAGKVLPFSPSKSLFSAMKEKFGKRLRSKTLDGQKNELLCKAICHNLCALIRAMYEFGIDPCDFFSTLES